MALRGWFRRLRVLIFQRRAEQEMERELRFHLDREAEKNMAAGMNEPDARRKARVDFGGLETVREEYRAARGLPLVEEMWADVRYALRGFARTPAFAATAILTLALGIGANTAIFSVVNEVMLKPLPFARPDELVMLSEDNPEKGWVRQMTAPANYVDWKERVSAFQDVMAYTMGGGETLNGIGDPVLVQGSSVTGNFFSVLGVNAAAGRVLRDDETWGGQGARVAVISDRLWRTQLGQDPKVIGRTIQVDRKPVEIVGVMPATFAFPMPDIDLWLPFGWDQSAR
ncbi:MAG TPA: ABC transporter permease, partial [Gemmatimonadales bacterium]